MLVLSTKRDGFVPARGKVPCTNTKVGDVLAWWKRDEGGRSATYWSVPVIAHGGGHALDLDAAEAVTWE